MIEIIIIVVIFALIFELTDSAAGMGFGTALSPLLLLLGYAPLQVVPTILISETMTGFIDAFFDHELKNVRFSFRPLNEATKFALLMGIFGCMAIFVSITLGYLAIAISKEFIKVYVAILLLFMGIFGVIRLKMPDVIKVSRRPKLLIGFAALAGFNKGIGGGGYGPVVTMGQIFSGIYEKSATAIVSLSEAMVSLTGIATFFLISSATLVIDLSLLPSVLLGSFFAALVSPFLVRIVPNKVWKILIPLYAIGIGIGALFFGLSG